MEVVIVEDEKLASDKLIMLLTSIDSSMDVKAVLTSVAEAKKWFLENTCELIFLDINLSDDLSFSIFKEVQVDTPIIFTTAYDEYAIRAFEQNSLAYLLKPIDKEELSKSLDKFHALNEKVAAEFYKKLNGLFDEMSLVKRSGKKRFSVSYGGKMRSVAIDDIAMFYVKSKVLYMATHSGTRYIMDGTLEKIEQEVSNDFFRINRQYLVHINSIDEVVPFSSRKLKVITKVETDEKILVPSEKITVFKKWFEG